MLTEKPRAHSSWTQKRQCSALESALHSCCDVEFVLSYGSVKRHHLVAHAKREEVTGRAADCAPACPPSFWTGFGRHLPGGVESLGVTGHAFRPCWPRQLAWRRHLVVFMLSIEAQGAPRARGVFLACNSIGTRYLTRRRATVLRRAGGRNVCAFARGTARTCTAVVPSTERKIDEVVRAGGGGGDGGDGVGMCRQWRQAHLVELLYNHSNRNEEAAFCGLVLR